nr:sulfite exporter TauE/SafE family protein [Treponema sp.]
MNKHYYVKIDGIYCAHCRTVISSFIKKADTDADIKISGNIARIKTDKLTDAEIVDAVTQAGYTTKKEWICTGYNKWKLFQILEFAGFALLIVLLRFILKSVLGYDILNVIPVIDTRLSFAGLLIAGFLTSFHCIGMCGAINLAVSKDWKKSVLYNGGRIFCYTAVGFFVGLLGKTLSINQTLLSVIIVVLSFFMIFLGLSMAGLFSVSFNHFYLPSKLKTSSVFLTGFLNGFIPCTPLITMQVYAVSTASPFKGALAMLMFGLGTLPLMLGFAFFQNMLAGKK